MRIFGLIAALHGGHTVGVDFGAIGPLASLLFVIAVLAISYRRSKQ